MFYLENTIGHILYLYFSLAGGKKKEAVEVEADPDEPPPALEVDVTIRMHRWLSTKESIDVEE